MSDTTRLLDQEFTAEVCQQLLPEWKGLDIKITQLSGGITNKLFRIQSEKGDHTVRIYGDKTDLFINRDYEAHTIQEMAKVGVASNLIKYMPEIGVTEIIAIAQAETVVNRNAITRARTTEMKVSHVAFSIPANTTLLKNTAITITARMPRTSIVP